MKRKWTKTDGGIIAPKLPWYVVGRIALGRTVDRLYYWCHRKRRFVDLFEHATAYRTKEKAESAALVMIAKNPKWIGRVEVTQETNGLPLRGEDSAHGEFEFLTRGIP